LVRPIRVHHQPGSGQLNLAPPLGQRRRPKVASGWSIFSRSVDVSIGRLPETNGFFFLRQLHCVLFRNGRLRACRRNQWRLHSIDSILWTRPPQSKRNDCNAQINVPGCAVSLAAKSSEEQQKYHLHSPGRLVAALLRLWQGIQLERDGSFTTADHLGRDHAAPLLLLASVPLFRVNGRG
jgi:hypothetical protein